MPSDFDHRKCPNCAGRTMRLTRVEPHSPDREDGYERHVYRCVECANVSRVLSSRCRRGNERQPSDKCRQIFDHLERFEGAWYAKARTSNGSTVCAGGARQVRVEGRRHAARTRNLVSSFTFRTSLSMLTTPSFSSRPNRSWSTTAASRFRPWLCDTRRRSTAKSHMMRSINSAR